MRGVVSVSAHSILAPSSAAVWSQCPGSVLASKAFAEAEEGEAARVGTAAHDAAASYITEVLGGKPAPEYVDESVEMYAQYVLGVARSGDCIVGVEERLECSAIHPECFGTCDAYVYNHVDRVLHVFDYKHGRGPVEVKQNRQLIAYTSGIIQKVPEVEKVILVIIQPRAFHKDGPIRKWETTRGWIKNATDALAKAAKEATGPNPPTVSGSHCRYCRMRWACPAAIEAGASLYEAVGSYVPNSVDGEDIGALYTVTLRALKHLEYLSAGLSAEIEARIRSGESVGGYRLKPSKVRKSWAVPAEDVITLGELSGVDVSKTDIVTPKQAADLGLEIPASYIKKESKMKLTEVNAAEVFGRK